MLIRLLQLRVQRRAVNHKINSVSWFLWTFIVNFADNDHFITHRNKNKNRSSMLRRSACDFFGFISISTFSFKLEINQWFSEI